MADNELLSARDAMSLLGINENDLQALVARGDLRAFRSGGTMKFRREDVSSLKTEKATEPTIILPAGGLRKAPAAASITVAQEPVGVAPSSDEIVLEDVELMPMDDATSTQQVTLMQQPASSGMLDAATAIGLPIDSVQETATIEEPSLSEPEQTATQPVATVKRGASEAAPAVSRVRQTGSGVTVASSRRSHAVYQAQKGSWVWTIFLTLTAIVSIYTACICCVVITKGFYDKDSRQRVIPPFLGPDSQVAVYPWCYDKTPGALKD